MSKSDIFSRQGHSPKVVRLDPSSPWPLATYSLGLSIPPCMAFFPVSEFWDSFNSGWSPTHQDHKFDYPAFTLVSSTNSPYLYHVGDRTHGFIHARQGLYQLGCHPGQLNLSLMMRFGKLNHKLRSQSNIVCSYNLRIFINI